MACCSSDDNLSDDEIFFGKLSLKEVKKCILFSNQRQSISFVFIYLLRLFVVMFFIIFIIINRLITFLTYLRCGTENNKFLSADSISVIETHSEPDIYSVRDTVASLDYSNIDFSPRASMDWDVKSTDDSFLKLEKMVTEMCMSPKKNNNDELDNTLEVVEFILNNAPLNDEGSNKAAIIISKEETEKNIPGVIETSIKKSYSFEEKNEDMQSSNKNVECKTMTHLQIESLYKTPLKKSCHLEKHVPNVKTEGISTPSVETTHTKVFKTPKNPLSSKKHQITSTKKTPGKINAYQHITSPVASYIKNCPHVPLLRDVHPKKPLPGTSSIPKFIKSTNDNRVGNKENVLLPSIAYKSAKKTKMITIPDKEKLPQSPWAKKLASLPKPVVIKHDHREMNSMKNSALTHPEDSFANLSLHQADLSVCTQKSAVTKLL